MWIRIKCPNGHELKIGEKYAGRRGKCPHCQARVLIPKLAKEAVEDAILDILGNEEPPVHQESERDEDSSFVLNESSSDSTLTGGSSLLQRATRKCPHCSRKVSANYTICPYCKTYLPERSDASERTSLSCPSCGMTSFPGAEYCTNCGEVLLIR